MAWVRPKHPKPKPVADNTEVKKSLLQYFSGQRARPSPPRIDRPVKLDPTLQQFADNRQVAGIPKPSSSLAQKPQARHHPRHRPAPVAVVVDYESDPDFEEYYEEQQPIAPPRRRVVPQPEPRYLPIAAPRHSIPTRPQARITPQRRRRDWDNDERSSWGDRSETSSRWASAVTPLPGLV